MSYTTTWEEITSHYRVKDREFPIDRKSVV
jgi:hypothetical protein